MMKVLLFLLFSSFAFTASAAPQKIIILYSDTGGGHVSTAKSIEQSVQQANPQAQIILKNIWDFAPKWEKKLKYMVWAGTLKYMPSLRDIFYNMSMEWGARADNLDRVKKYHFVIRKNLVYDFLAKESPDTVIAANYLGAEVLRVLRQNGFLKNVNLGWVLTDYAEGYWPRVSEYFDKTFLPHTALRQIWLDKGVAADKVEVSGVPTNPLFFKEKSAAAKSSDRRSIVVFAGTDGAAPLTEIVESLFENSALPLEVTVLAGKNETEFKKLKQLSQELPENFKLKVHGLVKQEELIGIIQASDLYITKAGGLSPTEGFIIGKPMVVFKSPGGGVEHKNIIFFKEQNLAYTVNETGQIAEAASTILDHPELQNEIIEAQDQFRESLNYKLITDFALKPRPTFQPESVPAPSLTESRAYTLEDENLSFQTFAQMVLDAKTSVDYNTYIQRMDEVGLSRLSLLRDAARRGLRVRVVFDDHGARKVSDGMLKHLLDSGVQIKIFRKKDFMQWRSLNKRMHDKYMSTDSQALLIEGRNAQNSYFGLTPEKNWHNFVDFGLYIESPKVRSTADRYFERLWQSEELSDPTKMNTVSIGEAQKAERLLNEYTLDKIKSLIPEWRGDIKKELLPLRDFNFVSDPLSLNDKSLGMTQDLFDLMKRAKSEIVIISPYFILTEEFKASLRELKLKNPFLKIKIYTNSNESNDNPFISAAYRRDLRELAEMGLETWEYNRSRMLHSKIIYIDGASEAFTGSYNVDPMSQNNNTELGVVAKPGAELAKRFVSYKDQVEEDSSKSTSNGRIVRAKSTTCQSLFELLAGPVKHLL